MLSVLQGKEELRANCPELDATKRQAPSLMLNERPKERPKNRDTEREAERERQREGGMEIQVSAEYGVLLVGRNSASQTLRAISDATSPAAGYNGKTP